MKGKPTVERIGEAALDLLEKEGPEAVTMRRVAVAAGITPMAIYYHFPSRDALLKSLTEKEFLKLREAIDETGWRQLAAPFDRLARMMEGYFLYALAHPRLYDYVFSKPRKDARQFPQDFRARRSPTLTPIADCVAEAMDWGALKEDDVWEIALQLWAVAHGYVALYRAGRFALSEEGFLKLCSRSLRRLLDGLAG
ncbi:MAG: TetR/AcrR family transcriptional regulator [Bryobacteraceae bacterium]